jgi:hypothetical protein
LRVVDIYIADALRVSFLPLSSTMPHGVSRFILISRQAQNIVL